MRKISYLQLQKKFSGKIVALDKKEKEVIAVGKRFSELFKKLEIKGFKPKNLVFVGPIQKAMSITFPYEKKLIDEGEIVDPRITGKFHKVVI